MITLTLSFDNGPDPVVTPQVLEILARNGIKATFFVVGQRLETPAGQALIARARAEGHWIGNHTYSHTVPFGMLENADDAIAEIERTSALSGALAEPHRLFRPYGGGGILDERILNPAAVRCLCDHGYSCITWNAIPRDWADPEGWVETALRQIAGQEETLMVLHDISSGAMDRLESFIERARDAGATFRQEFPASCVLIRNGKPTGDLAPYVSQTTFLS